MFLSFTNCRVHILDFIQVAWESVSILTSEPGPAAKLGQTRLKLEHLHANWPLSQVFENFQLVGLDGGAMKTLVLAEAERLKGLCTEILDKSRLQLGKSIKEAQKLLAKVCANDEAAFRKIMSQSSNKIAKIQQTITTVFDQVNAACASLGKVFKDEDSPNYNQAKVTIATCLYNVCVYTALTFYRSTATWKATKEGKKAKDNLGLVLQTLGENQDALQVEIHFQHELVKSIRTDAGVPRPKVKDGAETLELKAPGCPGPTVKKRGALPCPGPTDEVSDPVQAATATQGEEDIVVVTEDEIENALADGDAADAASARAGETASSQEVRDMLPKSPTRRTAKRVRPATFTGPGK